MLSLDLLSNGSSLTQKQTHFSPVSLCGVSEDSLWVLSEAQNALNSGLSFKDVCVLVSTLGRQHTPSPEEQTYPL